MDYTALAAEFMQTMLLLQKSKLQKKLFESLRGEPFILQALKHHGSAALPGELSGTMEISSARMAVALNSLEDKGLIVREIDKTDRRRILVNLTSKGEETVIRHQQILLGKTAQALSELGERDAKEYLRITKRLAQIMSQQKEEWAE